VSLLLEACSKLATEELAKVGIPITFSRLLHVATCVLRKVVFNTLLYIVYIIYSIEYSVLHIIFFVGISCAWEACSKLATEALAKAGTIYYTTTIIL
jgi:hypothetical protein